MRCDTIIVTFTLFDTKYKPYWAYICMLLNSTKNKSSMSKRVGNSARDTIGKHQLSDISMDILNFSLYPCYFKKNNKHIPRK